jgi:hypothetical protein
MAPAAFPAPDSPEGQAWAAAGYPVDEQKNPVIPDVPAPAPKDPPAVGSLAHYTFEDRLSSPPRDRTQVVLVTGVEDTGHVRGFPVGFADEAAAFVPEDLDY